MSGVILTTSNNARKLKISGNVHRYQWILLLKFEQDPIKFNFYAVPMRSRFFGSIDPDFGFFGVFRDFKSF